jgi:hypothetical protein
VGVGICLKSGIKPYDTVEEFASSKYIFNQVSAQYIMVKFPSLNKIYISNAWEIFANLSRSLQANFLKFVSEIHPFHLVGDVNNDAIAFDFTCKFLEASQKTITSQNDMVNLKLVYSRDNHENDGDGYNLEENICLTLKSVTGSLSMI